MSSKKNIDQLFKERFKNFEATPSPKVWANIQSQLKEQKEDRKVIPIWWKVAGVAALLALLFTIGNSIFKASEGDLIVTENIETIEQQNDTEKSQEIILNTSEDVLIASEDINTKGEENTSENNNKNLQQTSKTTQGVNNKNRNNTQSNTTVIATEHAIDKNKSPLNKNALENRFVDPTTIAKNERTGIATVSEENSEKKNIVERTTNPLIETNKKIETTGSAVTTTTQEKNTAETTQTTSESATDIKKSIFEAIEEDEIAVAKTNTKKQLDNRWEVAPNFAPVYYSSVSEGSSIDPSFSDNPQSGDVNFSYGVQVSYNINERLSIRSGISNVDLSYATSGIDLATGPVSQALRSIDYGDNTVVITALDAGTIPENNSGNPFDNLTPKSASGEIQLIQNISYFEVPLELKYTLINKKIGVNILGGFSSLFLNNNEISVRADNLNETLGEANNLSEVSFTTNVGLGLNYKINNKFTFNIEPMFKYQLNPYTDSSVNFKPYYIGLYTGFSYKF
jgi:hypothetical protein